MWKRTEMHRLVRREWRAKPYSIDSPHKGYGPKITPRDASLQPLTTGQGPTGAKITSQTVSILDDCCLWELLLTIERNTWSSHLEAVTIRTRNCNTNSSACPDFRL